jgi:hypothetical protein
MSYSFGFPTYTSSFSIAHRAIEHGPFEDDEIIGALETLQANDFCQLSDKYDGCYMNNDGILFLTGALPPNANIQTLSIVSPPGCRHADEKSRILERSVEERPPSAAGLLGAYFGTVEGESGWYGLEGDHSMQTSREVAHFVVDGEGVWRRTYGPCPHSVVDGLIASARAKRAQEQFDLVPCLQIISRDDLGGPYIDPEGRFRMLSHKQVKKRAFKMEKMRRKRKNEKRKRKPPSAHRNYAAPDMLHYITQQICCIPHPKMEGKAPAIGTFLAENHPHKFMLWNLSDNPTSQPVYTEFSNQVQQQCPVHWMPIIQFLPFPLLLHIGPGLFLEHRKVEKSPPVASGDVQDMLLPIVLGVSEQRPRRRALLPKR